MRSVTWKNRFWVLLVLEVARVFSVAAVQLAANWLAEPAAFAGSGL